MRSAVWDLLLLCMPEYLLVNGEPSGTTVAYVCTGDRALQKVAQCCKIRAVSAMQPKRFALPLLTADLTDLIPITGRAVLDEILESDRKWQHERLLQFPKTRSDIPSGDDLKRLVQDLEADVKQFCEL